MGSGAFGGASKCDNLFTVLADWQVSCREKHADHFDGWRCEGLDWVMGVRGLQGEVWDSCVSLWKMGNAPLVCVRVFGYISVCVRDSFPFS